MSRSFHASTEPGTGAVGLLPWRQPGGVRRPNDLQSVLVGAGEEEDVVAEKPVPARQGVGVDRRIGVADVGRVVHVEIGVVIRSWPLRTVPMAEGVPVMKLSGIGRKVDELGRVVLPVEMRRALGIGAGDEVDISLDDATDRDAQDRGQMHVLRRRPRACVRSVAVRFARRARTELSESEAKPEDKRAAESESS